MEEIVRVRLLNVFYTVKKAGINYVYITLHHIIYVGLFLFLYSKKRTIVNNLFKALQFSVLNVKHVSDPVNLLPRTIYTT